MLERGGCCRTDGPIRVLSCQMRHTIAAVKAARVALCVETPLRVRPTPPAAGSSPQLAASAESLLTDTERSNRRFFTCVLHISDVTPVRHAQGTLSILSARSLLVLLLCKQRCLSYLGHYMPLQRRSASDKCSVRCRPIKQRQNLQQLLIKT